MHLAKALFLPKHNLTDLVYFEEYKTARQAIDREKQLKNWKRQWKIELIQKQNPKMEILWQSRKRLRVKPAMTGEWQEYLF